MLYLATMSSPETRIISQLLTSDQLASDVLQDSAINRDPDTLLDTQPAMIVAARLWQRPQGQPTGRSVFTAIVRTTKGPSGAIADAIGNARCS